MTEPIRIQRVASMLQKTLGELLRTETSLFGKVLITVTAVRISADLGTAKVYLSLIPNTAQAVVLENIAQQKGVIRRRLGNRIGRKLRKVPDLRFYIDTSIAHTARMNQLLAELACTEDG